MRLPDWFTLPVFDMTPDPDVAAMLDQLPACDKHRELLDVVAIEKAQRCIVERRRHETIGAYYTPEPVIAAIKSGAYLTTTAHAIRGAVQVDR